MSDHTPGPWKLQHMTNGCRILGGPRLRIVAEVPAGREADAQLMSAAPDLLAACEMDGLLPGPGLLEYAADMLGGRSPHTSESLRRMAEAMRQAVAKAKGQEAQP